MTRFLREPLVHFLLVGIGLFVLFEVVNDDDSAYNSKVIDVDRDSLLTFIQFRTRAFEPDIAAARLDAMSGQELEVLIDDFVREEALYREALALGLDENDYIIKRRVIQSIEFITQGFVTAAVEVSDEDVAEYYAANRDDYFVAPYVTFTHVFFSAESRPREEVLALAQAKLQELNDNEVPFVNAMRHGDRFPYFVNYVERTPEFVASHFGTQMTEALFSQEADEKVWRGPYLSAYGAHLVLLTRKDDGFYPELDEVRDAVRQDAERVALDERNEQAVDAIIGSYEIRRDL